jgi:hypothetical protein
MRSVAIAPGPGLRMLLVAAAAQAAEAVGLCVAVVLNLVDAASGHSSTTSNAIGFIVLEAVVAVGVAAIAWGIVRVRPWSRTPAVMTQVLTAVIAIALLQADRYGWGVPALLLAVAGLAGLFTPSSLRALTRSRSPE